MRDLIGADAARVLPQLEKQDFTFLIEDPATVWNLGPQRYPQIAERYKPLTARQSKLAIDINIVERYQDVYPTKQQTGVELFQLVHTASRSFPRVALYFENSIGPEDVPWMGSAAAVVTRFETVGDKTVLESPYGVGIPWAGPALVNGKLWPVRSSTTLWLPAGSVVAEHTEKDTAIHILDFNGQLRTARVEGTAMEMSYQQPWRAIAILDREPASVEVDGVPERPMVSKREDGAYVLTLPSGQHLVSLH